MCAPVEGGITMQGRKIVTMHLLNVALPGGLLFSSFSPTRYNRLKQSAKPPPDALKYSLDVGNTAIIQFQYNVFCKTLF